MDKTNTKTQLKTLNETLTAKAAELKAARAKLKEMKTEVYALWAKKKELRAALKAERKAAYDAYKKGVEDRKAKRAEKRAVAEKARAEKKANVRKVVRKPLTKAEADEILKSGEKSLAKYKKAAAKKSPIVKTK